MRKGSEKLMKMASRRSPGGFSRTPEGSDSHREQTVSWQPATVRASSLFPGMVRVCTSIGKSLAPALVPCDSLIHLGLPLRCPSTEFYRQVKRQRSEKCQVKHLPLQVDSNQEKGWGNDEGTQRGQGFLLRCHRNRLISQK